MKTRGLGNNSGLPLIRFMQPLGRRALPHTRCEPWKVLPLSELSVASSYHPDGGGKAVKP